MQAVDGSQQRIDALQAQVEILQARVEAQDKVGDLQAELADRDARIAQFEEDFEAVRNIAIELLAQWRRIYGVSYAEFPFSRDFRELLEQVQRAFVGDRVED